MAQTDVMTRSNVTVRGSDGAPTIVFAHGFGCDQTMWRFVAPAFEDRFRTATYDQVGFGGSDLGAFDADRHHHLDGYADDLLGIVQHLDVGPVWFVGHSVSAMIGVLAAAKEPEWFRGLVMVCPSPCYIDDDAGYRGGFTRAEIDDLLETLDQNYLGWSDAVAPVIMGNPDRPELGHELANSFCRTDPTVAKAFARVTFLSDTRADLARVRAPVLVLQCTDDAIAPDAVGEYVADHLPDGHLVKLDATGHCPNLSAPAETVSAIAEFVGRG